MRYLQACHGRKCLIDKKDFKFVPETVEALQTGIEVPFYLWYFASQQEHKAKVYGKDAGTFHKVDVMELNNLVIGFKSLGYKAVEIKFFNPLEGRFVHLKLGTTLYTQSTRTGIELMGMSYQFTIDDSPKQEFLVELKKPTWVNPNFCRVQGLGSSEVAPVGINRFCFGIQPCKYLIRYKGRKLKDNRYAMLGGPWGILLQDDLSFDSLVLLNGATSAVLEIDTVAYTVNSSVVKAMTLMR